MAKTSTSVCAVLKKKGRGPRNKVLDFIERDKESVATMQRLLQMRPIEAAVVGSAMLVVIEGETRGAIFMINGGKKIRFIKSYGDELVPDAAIERTLGLIYGDVPKPLKLIPKNFKRGRGRPRGRPRKGNFDQFDDIRETEQQILREENFLKEEGSHVHESHYR